nr:hypothetical protein [Tanacetum cinerariifolium]
MPPKPGLVFNTAPIAAETAHSAFTVKFSSSEPTQDLSHTNRPSAPIIEEWVSDSDDDSETTAPHIAHTDTPKPTSPKTSSSGKRKNRKTCFVCRSVDHFIKDCNYHAMKKAQPTSRNYVHKGTHKQNASFTRHHPQMHIVPAAVLTQHITHGQSPKISNSPPRVTAAQAPVVSAAKEIIKLKSRVKKLERANKVKTMKLRILRKVETSQRIESSDDTIMEDVSNQGKMIDESDKTNQMILRM